MTKARLLILLALAAAISGCASTRAILTAPGAVPVTESAARYAFGNVQQGEMIRVEFEVRNTAPYYVSVEKVENVCGCTTTSLAADTIAPGDAVSLWVSLDTASLWGPQAKTVIVHLDDPYRRMVRLTVEGVVKELLHCEPRRVDEVTKADSVVVAVRFENTADRELVLKAAAVDPPNHVTIDFPDKPLPLHLAAGESATVNVRAELARPGVRLVGKILLTIEGAGDTVKLPFYFERPADGDAPKRRPL